MSNRKRLTEPTKPVSILAPISQHNMVTEISLRRRVPPSRHCIWLEAVDVGLEILLREAKAESRELKFSTEKDA